MMEPIAPATDPFGIPQEEDPLAVFAPLEEDIPEPFEDETISREPVAGSAAGAKITLSDENESELANTIETILHVFEDRMAKRLDVEAKYQNAFDLEPDPNQGGQFSGAARMCSDMTRRLCNQTSAGLIGGVLRNRPYMKVNGINVQDDTEANQEVMDQAKATERFLDGYGKDVGINERIKEEIDQIVQRGWAVSRIMWVESDEESYQYTDNGKIEKVTVEGGQVDWRVLANPDVVFWPMHEPKAEKMKVIGHRDYYTEAELRQQFSPLGVAKEKLESAILSQERDTAAEDGLKQEKISPPSSDPFDGLIPVWELWCNMPLPGDDRPTKFVVYYQRDRGIFGIQKNTLDSGRAPYFVMVYNKRARSFIGTGLAHDVSFHHAADSALWNLEIDNAKVVGNNVIMYKTGSEAEGHVDEIYPGKRVPVDDENDLTVLEMGNSIDGLALMRSRTRQEGEIAGGVPAVMQGRGDPVMKSGATAGGHASLVAQASLRPGRIDDNMRGSLSEKYMFMLELVQQYARDGVYHSVLDSEDAGVMAQQKFMVPSGDLRRTYRISVRSSSISANREVQQQNVLLVWNFAKEMLQLALQVGPMVFADNPALQKEIAETCAKLVFDSFAQMIELHDMQGMTAPEIDAPTPIEERYNELMQQYQQLQMQMQQLMAQQPQQPGQPGQPPPQPQGPPM